MNFGNFNAFENLKDENLFIKIFDHMAKKKALEIIKWNKKIQQRLNLDIKNYKDYSQRYSSIEIELKLADNQYGKFINISHEYKDYYHIYFNNSTEEEDKINIDEDDNVQSIKIKIDYQIISLNELFLNCDCISSINFKKFSRNNIIYMSAMFSGCSSLKQIIFSNFTTDNVTDMNFMFNDCSSLKELNLSNFNTNNVTKMDGMFSGCSSLNQLLYF